MLDNRGLYLLEELDDRQLKLLHNCMTYGRDKIQGGLPGHNLMLLVNQLTKLIGITDEDVASAMNIYDIRAAEIEDGEPIFTENMRRYMNKCIGVENGCACDLCYNEALEMQLYDESTDPLDDEPLPFDEPVECECCDKQLQKMQYNHLTADDDWFAESDGVVLLEECACTYCQWQRDKDDIETKTALLKELHETIGEIVAISGRVLKSWDKF